MGQKLLKILWILIVFEAILEIHITIELDEINILQVKAVHFIKALKNFIFREATLIRRSQIFLFYNLC